MLKHYVYVKFYTTDFGCCNYFHLVFTELCAKRVATRELPWNVYASNGHFQHKVIDSEMALFSDVPLHTLPCDTTEDDILSALMQLLPWVYLKYVYVHVY